MKGEERARSVTIIVVDRVIFVCIVGLFLRVEFQSDVRIGEPEKRTWRVTGVRLSEKVVEVKCGH